MVSLQSLCEVSKLISKLNDSNYFSCDHTIDLSTLLQNLNIHESTNDVFDLICANKDNLLGIIEKLGIGIERALMICDELCAPYVISLALRCNLPLNRVMDNHIINFGSIYVLQRAIEVYNRGYKIITSYDSHIYCNYTGNATLDTQMINNAFNNGLFIQSMSATYINGNIDILPHILDDIIYIQNLDESSHSNKILSTCRNIESIGFPNNVDLRNSPSIKNIKNLKSSRATDDMLKLCINLCRLYAFRNNSITTCAPFSSTLRMLDAEESSLGDSGLQMCKKIKSLDATHNKYITTCEPFAHSLIILLASHSGITDAGLASCTRIKKLYACGNEKITTCEPFAHTLKHLLATEESCGISNSGLAHCYKLKTLHVGSNNKINTIVHFSSLTRFTHNFLNLSLEGEIKMFKNLRCK